MENRPMTSLFPPNTTSRCSTWHVLLIVTIIAARTVAGGNNTFNEHWQDGRAELNGYRWHVTRYGQVRNGQAVLVYVTEPFNRSKLVKSNTPLEDPAHTLEVLKLNMVRDFQTGIYDYNTMVSVFARSDRFEPLKISFSSAEWCGHVYEQLQYQPNQITNQIHSYFEDESAIKTIEQRAGGVTEDNLFILLRGLRGPFLQPGQTRSVAFLPSSFYRRLAHRRLSWSSAQIHRHTDLESINVPAGTFTTIVYTVTTSQNRKGQFFVDQDYPHRIIQWNWRNDININDHETDESGQLSGATRLKYWSLKQNGHEHHLKTLGLSPTVD